jgi:hypothetical protein
MRILILSYCAIVAAGLWARQAAGESATLCAADEQVVFSCSTGPKLISICASSGEGKPAKSLHYRFGKPDHIELSYPESPGSPADGFTSGAMMFSGGGGAWLRFSRAPYQYTIFSAVGKWGPGGSPKDLAGVAVNQNSMEIANIACRSAVTGPFGPDYFEKAGVKSNPDDDFDIPEAFFRH